MGIVKDLIPGRCRESVSNGPRSMMFHQCHKPDGYGPGKAYCKQHAPKNETTKATVPLWELRNSRYELSMPEKIMAREAGEKTYIDTNGRRNSYDTEYSNVFKTEKEALTYTLNLAQGRRRSLLQQVAEATKVIGRIQLRLKGKQA